MGERRSCSVRLDPQRPEGKRSKGWPSTGPGMGRQLTRLAPSLRKLGYTADWRRRTGGTTGGWSHPDKRVD